MPQRLGIVKKGQLGAAQNAVCECAYNRAAKGCGVIASSYVVVCGFSFMVVLTPVWTLDGVDVHGGADSSVYQCVCGFSCMVVLTPVWTSVYVVFLVWWC
jgi:hypothetical protein